jgi:hypothetical protein
MKNPSALEKAAEGGLVLANPIPIYYPSLLGIGVEGEGVSAFTLIS